MSVIAYTDMVNVYNRTSGIIKNPTVHRISVCVRVVPVLARMLKLGIVHSVMRLSSSECNLES